MRHTSSLQLVRTATALAQRALHHWIAPMQSAVMAVIADVHGNSRALEAVFADIARRQVSLLINLGDNANGPLEPARAVELLRGSGAIHIRGNGDRMTGEAESDARRSALFARQQLDANALRWLRELPQTATGDGWFACHGSPTNDEEYLLENVVGGKTVLAHPDEIAARVGAVDASLILCGHSHIPRCVQLSDGRVIVNPGSVGLPAYEDANPTPHVVETGSPAARYAIIEHTRDSWRVELVSVPYDWKSAAAAARQIGWPTWAQYLATGYCS